MELERGGEGDKRREAEEKKKNIRCVNRITSAQTAGTMSQNHRSFCVVRDPQESSSPAPSPAQDDPHVPEDIVQKLL